MPWQDIDMDAPENGAESASQSGGSGEIQAGSNYPNDLWVEEYHKGRAVPIYINSNVTGGYVKYPGTLSETLGRSSTIPLHRVEENFDIGDHISIDACTIAAKLTLVRELNMQKELEMMLKAKELVDVKCSLGEFKNMGIVALDFRETGFQNTLECDIKFLEVRVGKTTISQYRPPNDRNIAHGAHRKTNNDNDKSNLEYF